MPRWFVRTAAADKTGSVVIPSNLLDECHGSIHHRCLDSTDSLPVCRIPFKLYTLKCVSIPYFCEEIVRVLPTSHVLSAITLMKFDD